MLVLTRKLGETFVIGNDITIKLLSVDDKRARIGISAPRDIAVHRQEIYDRIKMGEPNEKK